MNIAVIGAGAMGCLYACMLSEKNRVTLYDISTEIVDAINSKGIVLRSPSGSEKVYSVTAKTDCKGDSAELVILFVKDTASRAALKGNRELISDSSLLLSLQNGMGNEEIMEEFADRSNIFLGTTKHNCVSLAPGVIYHSGSGITHVGSPSGSKDAAVIGDCFRSCGIETEECDDVKRLLWEKLFVNMTVNPITAIFGTKISLISENESAKRLARVLIDEAVVVAERDGEVFDADEVFGRLISTAGALSSGTASMCQDIEHGRRTEIDFINGAVVKLGEKYGVPAPTHKAICLMIKTKEALTYSKRKESLIKNPAPTA